MLNQFSRTQLLLGAENMDRLAKAKVAIFGIGGVGGYVAEALARSGVGSFVLVDDDKVCLTIINRRYVAKENKNLYMTELGEVVNNMMKEAFPSIVDVNFTATMEALLDRVGDGSVPWKTVVENFWPDLYEAVTEAEKNLEEVKVEDEVTDVICENCGRNMVVKYGPHGKFLACPGFPDCKNTKPYLEKIGVPCPKCGKEVILRKTKKGRKYYGCENNPECDFMSWQKPSAKKCPQCGGYMLEKGNKLVCADEQCGYVEAREKKDED